MALYTRQVATDTFRSMPEVPCVSANTQRHTQPHVFSFCASYTVELIVVSQSHVLERYSGGHHETLYSPMPLGSTETQKQTHTLLNDSKS